jgi:putative membrane protein insertion efficiency factor
MGHCDSSAHFRGNGGVRAADGRIDETSAAASERRAGGELGSWSRSMPGIGMGEYARAAGKWLLLLLVRFYQIFLSPFFGGACKFYPSCSKYGYEAIARHGAWRGSVLAAKRLLRCRPFTKGGFDPVPDVDSDSIEERRNLQGLKPHFVSGVDVAAEAASHKDGERKFAQ